jgi:hypothetical protein
MRKFLLIVLFAGLTFAMSTATGRTAGAADLSGAWAFSVDLDEGGHGEPTFVFKQAGDELTGSYSGPLGDYKVTGNVTGAKAVFGFDFVREGEKLKATYKAVIESATKMTGEVEFSNGGHGKWTATKKG